MVALNCKRAPKIVLLLFNIKYHCRKDPDNIRITPTRLFLLLFHAGNHFVGLFFYFQGACFGHHGAKSQATRQRPAHEGLIREGFGEKGFSCSCIGFANRGDGHSFMFSKFCSARKITAVRL